MESGVVLSWTPTNWLTVFLMALGGFVIIKVILAGAQKVAAAKGGN